MIFIIVLKYLDGVMSMIVQNFVSLATHRGDVYIMYRLTITGLLLPARCNAFSIHHIV